MKAVLAMGAGVFALMLASSSSFGQWSGDGYRVYPTQAQTCRVVREWRHGELRIVRICRAPAYYGRWRDREFYRGGPRYYDDWDRSRWHRDRGWDRGDD
jgi:hypothetical protein